MALEYKKMIYSINEHNSVNRIFKLHFQILQLLYEEYLPRSLKMTAMRLKLLCLFIEYIIFVDSNAILFLLLFECLC